MQEYKRIGHHPQYHHRHTHHHHQTNATNHNTGHVSIEFDTIVSGKEATRIMSRKFGIILMKKPVKWLISTPMLIFKAMILIKAL